MCLDLLLKMLADELAGDERLGGMFKCAYYLFVFVVLFLTVAQFLSFCLRSCTQLFPSLPNFPGSLSTYLFYLFEINAHPSLST